MISAFLPIPTTHPAWTAALWRSFFGKEHKNVLRDVDALRQPDSGFSPEFGRLNFEPSSYLNQQNKRQRCYAMTRDGFTALAMGFTGKKAAQFKEAYIRRFNEMEQFIVTLVRAREQFPLLTQVEPGVFWRELTADTSDETADAWPGAVAA